MERIGFEVCEQDEVVVEPENQLLPDEDQQVAKETQGKLS